MASLDGRLAELDKRINEANNKSAVFDQKAAGLDADYTAKIAELEEKRKSVDNLLSEVRALHDNYFKKDESTSTSKAEVLTEHHNSIVTFKRVRRR